MDTRSGLHGMAVSFVRDRRRPANQELMTSNCKMLSAISRSFPASTHGFSTTLMASMFSSAHLSANLSFQEFFKLVSFLNTGRPEVRSAFDGRAPPRMEQHPPAVLEFEEFAQELLADDSDVVGETTPGVGVFEELDLLQVPTECEAGDDCSKFNEALVSPSLADPPQRAARAPPSPTPKKRDRSTWNRAEDDFILNYYAEHGPLWREMSSTLAVELSCARSDDALRNRYDRLTTSRQDCASTSSETSSKSSGTQSGRPPRTAWTKEEDRLICETVRTWADGRAGWQHLSRRLPGRTAHAVRNRASRMLLESRRSELLEEGPSPR